MAADALSDESLIRRIQSGDEKAFEVLFDRYVPLLRRRIGRWLPSRLQRKVSISDVLQETRIVALRGLGEFEHRGDGSVRRWLDRIAEMKVREVVRRYARTIKRGVRRELSRGARPDTANFVANGPSPSEAAIAAETAALVEQALATLRPDDRQVLRLVREEQLTLEEAGRRMGRNREAAKKL